MTNIFSLKKMYFHKINNLLKFLGCVRDDYLRHT